MTIQSKTGQYPKPENKEIKSKSERRKNFDPRKWASKYLNSGGLPERVSVPNLDGETRLPKTMSNEDRKRLGEEIDAALEPVPCDKCGTITVNLKLIPIDKGQGMQFFYHCPDCVLGKSK